MIIVLYVSVNSADFYKDKFIVCSKSRFKRARYHKLALIDWR